MIKLLARIALHADTKPTRFMLAFASVIWAAVLAAPSDSLSGTAYRQMLVAAPEWVWTFMFVTYAVGVWTRLLHDGERPRLELMVNTAGVLLFSTTATAAIINGAGLIGHAVPQVTLALAAVWIFARTAECPGWRRRDGCI